MQIKYGEYLHIIGLLLEKLTLKQNAIEILRYAVTVWLNLVNRSRLVFFSSLFLSFMKIKFSNIFETNLFF